jgi:hypothetical protein
VETGNISNMDILYPLTVRNDGKLNSERRKLYKYLGARDSASMMAREKGTNLVNGRRKTTRKSTHVRLP